MKEKILLVIIAMVLIATLVTGVWRLTDDGLGEWALRIYQGRIEFEDIISLIGIYSSIIEHYDNIIWQQYRYYQEPNGKSTIWVAELETSESIKIWEGYLRDDRGVEMITQAFSHTILPIGSLFTSYLGGTFATVGLITGKIGTMIMRAVNATMWLLGFA